MDMLRTGKLTNFNNSKIKGTSFYISYNVVYILQCGLGYVPLPLNWHGCPTTPLPTSVTRMRALLYTLATNGPAGSFWPATDTSTK